MSELWLSLLFLAIRWAVLMIFFPRAYRRTWLGRRVHRNEMLWRHQRWHRRVLVRMAR